MNDSPGDVRSLVAAIHNAFDAQELPPDGQIIPRSSISDEACEVEEAYWGIRWQDVPRSILGNNDDSLCFMTPQAFVHYLPRYLVEAVENTAEPGSGIVEDLITQLSPTTSQDFLNERLELMTTDQKKVIARVFEHIVNVSESFVSQRAAENLALLWRDV